MKYLIDTDWVIDCLKGKTPAVETLLRLAAEDRLAISIITYGEVYEGAYYSSDPEKHLNGFRDFLEDTKILDIDRDIIERFAVLRGKLRKQGTLVGDFDLLIATTALQYDLILVTRNLKHFRRVQGLSLF